MAAFLVPLQPGACVIPLEKAILLIGRQADCDVSLTASRKISRKHCCIAIVNDTIVVRDLGSTNGVSINGNRIEQEGRLRLGDELSIGDVRFRLQKEAQLNPPPSSNQIPNNKVTAPAPPSLDFPVAITDEDQDFAVESTMNRRAALNTSSSKKTESDSGPLLPFLAADKLDVLPMPSDSV